MFFKDGKLGLLDTILQKKLLYLGHTGEPIRFGWFTHLFNELKKYGFLVLKVN